MTFALMYWKQLAVLAVMAVLVGIAGFYKVANDTNKAKLQTAQLELRLNAEKFDELARKGDELMDRLGTAQKQIQALEANTKVKVIREQVVPKECTAAIEFAIQNAGDLEW